MGSPLLLLSLLLGISLRLVWLQKAVSAVYLVAGREFTGVNRKLPLPLPGFAHCSFQQPYGAAESRTSLPQKAAIKTTCCLLRRRNLLAQLLSVSSFSTFCSSFVSSCASSALPSLTRQERSGSRTAAATPWTSFPVAVAAGREVSSLLRAARVVAAVPRGGSPPRTDCAAACITSLPLAAQCCAAGAAAAAAAPSDCLALRSLPVFPDTAGPGATRELTPRLFAGVAGTATAAAKNARTLRPRVCTYASHPAFRQQLAHLLLPSPLLSACLDSEQHHEQDEGAAVASPLCICCSARATLDSVPPSQQHQQHATRPKEQQQTTEQHGLDAKRQQLRQVEQPQQQLKEQQEKTGGVPATTVYLGTLLQPCRRCGSPSPPPAAAGSSPASVAASSTGFPASSVSLPSASSRAAGITVAFAAADGRLFAAAASFSSPRWCVKQPASEVGFPPLGPSLRFPDVRSVRTAAASLPSRLPLPFVQQRPHVRRESPRQQQQRSQRRSHYHKQQPTRCHQQQHQQQRPCWSPSLGQLLRRPLCRRSLEQQQRPFCLPPLQQRQENFVPEKQRLSAAGDDTACDSRAAAAVTATARNTAEGLAAETTGEGGLGEQQSSSSFDLKSVKEVNSPAALPVVYTPLLTPASFPAGHTLQPQKCALLFAALQSSAASVSPPAPAVAVVAASPSAAARLPVVAPDAVGPPSPFPPVTPAESSSLPAAARAPSAAATAPSGPAAPAAAAAPPFLSPSSAALPPLSAGAASSLSSASVAAEASSFSAVAYSSPSPSPPTTSSASVAAAATASSPPSSAVASFPSPAATPSPATPDATSSSFLSPAASASATAAAAAGDASSSSVAADASSSSALYAATAVSQLTRLRRPRFTLFSPVVDEQTVLQWLCQVHAPAYVRSAAAGTLSEQQQRKIGLPVASDFLRRSLAEVSCTVLGSALAAEVGLACVVGGGTHHAKYAEGGKYCLFNDVAVAAALALQQGRARKILVLDLDVHQGDGTADIFKNDARVTTVSVHCEDNFPFDKAVSDVDVGLPSGTGDCQYLRVLDELLPRLLREVQPSLMFYIAGVDVHAEDSLGNLLLTDAALHQRDALVLQHCLNYNQRIATALRCNTSSSNRVSSSSSSAGSSTRGSRSSDNTPTSSSAQGSALGCRAEGSCLGSRLGVCCVIGGGYAKNIRDVVHRHSIIFKVASHFLSHENFSGVYAAAASPYFPLAEASHSPVCR